MDRQIGKTALFEIVVVVFLCLALIGVLNCVCVNHKPNQCAVLWVHF